MNSNSLLFYIYCFLIINVGLGQVQDGTPCYTSKQEYGLCVNIKNCDFMLNLLRTQSSNPQVRNYLVSSTCGYIGTTPMVCCPQNKPRIITPNIDTDNVDAGDSPSENIDIENETNENKIQLRSPPECGFSNVTNYKVVGGIPAKLNEFPWIVALGYRNNRNPQVLKWLCGGSLITDIHILTAAHCVHNRRDLFMARLGELDLYDNNDGAFPEDILLIKAKVHENYSPVQFTNDIAILTMERPPTNSNVWPICLPHQEPLRSHKFLKFSPVVAGWGALYFDGPTSSILQLAEIPVVSNDRCKKAFGDKTIIDDRILCAGWTTGEKDACQGDSGGPLIYGKSEGQNLRYYQIGIVSYGFRCAEAGYPGVYTRVTNFIDWIRRNID